MANYRLHVSLVISILAIFCGFCPALAERGDFGHSSLAANRTAEPLALGLKDAGLEAFAKSRGATLATGDNWQATGLQKLKDPKTPVHFNLDGVEVWKGVTRAASGRGGSTDWELLQIKQNPQWWDTIKFWENGKQVPNPFQ
jgi:hypothetical protein